jgi:hypothetical protein
MHVLLEYARHTERRWTGNLCWLGETLNAGGRARPLSAAS